MDDATPRPRKRAPAGPHQSAHLSKEGRMPSCAFPRLRGLVLLGLLLALAVPVHAQFDTGQISGFVRDEQGGVVPGATIKVINEATKVERTYHADATGYFTAPALPPGSYQVEIELAGFRKYVQTGIKLDATAKAQVDAVLVPGGIEETVTIVAE